MAKIKKARRFRAFFFSSKTISFVAVYEPHPQNSDWSDKSDWSEGFFSFPASLARIASTRWESLSQIGRLFCRR